MKKTPSLTDLVAAAGGELTPTDRRIAEAYSRGELIVDALPEYRPLFDGLRDRLDNLVQQGARAHADL